MLENEYISLILSSKITFSPLFLVVNVTTLEKGRFPCCAVSTFKWN